MARQLVSFDWAMKRILREKTNFDILEGFLSELFGFDIKISQIIESEANQEDRENKFNRVDLLAKDDRDRLILIELQHDSENDYFHRMLYGTSKLISEYIKLGDSYKEVKKVYSVNIVYFGLGQGVDYLYKGAIDFRGLNRDDDKLELNSKQKELFGDIEVADIFPEYYIIKVDQFDKLSKYSSLDEWIYFLKNEEIKSDFSAKGLDKAKEKLDMMKLPESERKIYKRALEDKRLESSLLESAKFEGERNKAIEIAKNSLAKGLDIATVSEITGLSIDTVEKLK